MKKSAIDCGMSIDNKRRFEEETDRNRFSVIFAIYRLSVAFQREEKRLIRSGQIFNGLPTAPNLRSPDYRRNRFTKNLVRKG
ncbi:unnamed protein product [Orchesella dallaii]|uniref:Uncharacterized protein n=1 Tax=Orchesella dallaii TaxID=48710 RepID=A0ABP1R5S3_9HEXA